MPNSGGSSPRNVDDTAGLLAEIFRQGRLILRLLGDSRVPAWLKAIPIGGVLYALSPIDLVPDAFIGFGQLDDVAILLLGFKLFLDLMPRDILAEHQTNMASNQGKPDEPQPGSYVDASYRVIDEEDKKN